MKSYPQPGATRFTSRLPDEEARMVTESTGERCLLLEGYRDATRARKQRWRTFWHNLGLFCLGVSVVPGLFGLWVLLGWWPVSL